MKALLTKTLISVIVLTLFILASLYFSFEKLYSVLYYHEKQIVNKGVFTDVQERLKTTPQSQWNELLNNLKPRPKMTAEIVKISDLHLPHNKKRALRHGNIVSQMSQKVHFLYFTDANIYDYQRIGSSNYALKLQFDLSIHALVEQPMTWMIRLVQLRLNETPKKQWPEELIQLQSQYQLPMQLMRMNSSQVTNKVRSQLKSSKIAYELPTQDNYIRVWYLQSPNPNLVIKVGPVNYPWWRRHATLIQFLYAFIFSVVVVVILTGLFGRNVRKIYQITQQYSRGNFAYRRQFSRLSMLYSIYINVLAMGKKLKSLIESQNNLTRFVAHETRTPLSTMQLTLDALHKESNLSPAIAAHIKSLQDDIDDLNMLVTQFLIYSQNTTQDLVIVQQPCDLVVCLQEIIGRFQPPNIEITFKHDQQALLVNIDKRLFKHAVSNLIGNAIKFAQEYIQIQLVVLEASILVHVDDDGPGIEEEEREAIFKAFETLGADAALGRHIGLGLMIARMIVVKHQGQLTVGQSPDWGGSRFTIQLPYMRAAIEP